MIPATNWLSFSLAPSDMLGSLHSPPEEHRHRSHLMHYEGSPAMANHYLVDNFYTNAAETSMEPPSEIHRQSHAPKLEDFFGENSCNTAAPETSTLGHIYNTHRRAVSYFSGDPHAHEAIAGSGIKAFPANSLLEADEQVRNDYAVRGSRESNVLSLGVNGISSQTSQESSLNVSGTEDKKVSDTFGQRTSIYRGVTRHRWTGRYEAHLWDNSCRREGQARKGRQVYLGGYDKEEKAARAYDLAALKYWGPTATTNFPVTNYSKELEEMNYISKQEFIASLRRKSSGFSRGASIYRGVTRHHQQGRWQARIGRVAGNKDLYLGTFATEEEAAEAYDIAAIKFRGLNAVTNFEMSRYDVEAIIKSALPIGGAAKRLKLAIEPDQKPTQLQSCYNGDISGNTISTIPNSSFYNANSIFHQLAPLGNSAALESDACLASSSPITIMHPSEMFFWPSSQHF